MEDKLKIYAALKLKISALEDELKPLVEEIQSMMVAEEVDEIGFELGKISLSYLKTWTYPDEVNDLLEEGKQAKKTAEKIGTATFVEKPSIKFYPKKD